jgi:hypothetical protein
MKKSDWEGALKENFEIWKVVAPVLLGILVLGSAVIKFALNEPILFLAWSITCFVAGLWAHVWWCKHKPEPTPGGGWSSP